MNLAEWIERFAGWGVVVWIVQRMMRSADGDRQIFRDAVEEFRGYRTDDEEAHRQIVESQREILEHLRALKDVG